MNTYYQNHNQVSSNNDIFDEYFFGGAHPVSAWKKATDRVLAILSAIILFFCNARVRTVARISVVAISLVALVGIIGAVEHGTLSLGLGLLFGLSMVALEVSCLRRRR